MLIVRLAVSDLHVGLLKASRRVSDLRRVRLCSRVCISCFMPYLLTPLVWTMLKARKIMEERESIERTSTDIAVQVFLMHLKSKQRTH
jgi:hypothetical protein